jgi:hypothetical protein
VVQGKEWLGSGVQSQIKRRTQPRDAAFHVAQGHLYMLTSNGPRWTTPQRNKQLGITSPYMSNVINASGHKLLENRVMYQQESPKIETGGRHIIYRILKLVQHGLKQREYKDHMRLLKARNPNKSYDEIVSSIIRR